MSCIPLEVFIKYARELNEVAIDEDSEKSMRFNTWLVKPENVAYLIHNNTSDKLPGIEASKHIRAKVDKLLGGITRTKTLLTTKDEAAVNKFESDLLGEKDGEVDRDGIKKSIAINEVMEAIKGEADKARNNDIDISEIAVNGILPRMPLSRLAAIIGRKIMFANKARFKSNEDSSKTAAEVETMYYAVGLSALTQLEKLGYIKLEEGEKTLRDYTDAESELDRYAKGVEVVERARSVSINNSAFGIEKYAKDSKGKDTDTLTEEAAHFLNRTAAELEGTKLGAMVGMLSVIRNVTQPSGMTMPDTGSPDKDKVLADLDPDGNVQSPSTEAARQKLYDKPLFVNSNVHKLLKMLQDDTKDSDSVTATKRIMKVFGNRPALVQSLFGIKNSANFSIDRKESVTGQNLSKTVPLDDIVETYSILTDDKGDPIGLHMAMKGGRNQRLYYDNSVMNAHASKQSRHMLNSGSQTLEFETDDFHRIVSTMSDTLGDDKITYSDIVSGGNKKLDSALDYFNQYEKSKDSGMALTSISFMAQKFPGIDYASLLTVLGGISDIRKAKAAGDTHVTTEFMDSADATSQGGMLTFQQALTTNENPAVFMQRIGFFEDSDGSLAEGSLEALDDVYGLMSEGVSKYISGKGSRVMAEDTGVTEVKELLQQTLSMLFGDSKKGERDLSKYSTMPFIYGQGEKGAESSMTNSIASHIADSLGVKGTKDYLAVLLDDPTLTGKDAETLNVEAGLYDKIKDALNAKRVPQKLYEIMQAEINDVYLKEYKADAALVWGMVERVKHNHRMKVLPLGAVLDGIGVDQVEKYGMTLTKIEEVSSPVTGGVDEALVAEGGHTVLTRKQKIAQSIMDVSVTHGMDSGLMYHALNEVMEDTGAIIVHDQVIGSVKLVRMVEEAYVRLNTRLIREYDVHQQVLNAVAHYGPEIADTTAFKKLKARVDARLEAKNALVDSGVLNDATDALIGSGQKYKEFSEGQVTKEATTTNNKPKTVPKKASETVSEEASGDLTSKLQKLASKYKKVSNEQDTKSENTYEDLTWILEGLASQSPLITKFLETSDKPVIRGKSNAFDTQNNQITITGTDSGIDYGTKLDPTSLEQKELIEHEIIHHNTAGYIAKVMAGPKGSHDRKVLDYINRAVQAIHAFKSAADTDIMASMEDGVLDRMLYIIKPSHTPETQIAEFVAIMSAETEVSKGIYKALGLKIPTKTLMDTIKDFLEAVKAYVLDFTDADTTKPLSGTRIQEALAMTLENGRSFKEQQIDEAIRYEKGFKTLLAGTTGSEESTLSKVDMRYLNSAVASMLNSKLEKNGKRLVGQLHAIMKQVFPLYTDASEKLQDIYSGSDALQALMHTITGEGTDKDKKADLLAKAAKIESDHNTSIDFQRSEFKKLLKDVDSKTRKTIGRFVTQLPLHEYFANANDIDTADKIDAEVSRLEEEIHKVDRNAIRDVDSLIDRNVQGNDGGSLYNLNKYSISSKDELNINVNKLLALKSIQAIGSKDFESFLARTDLVNLIKDNVMANKLSLLTIEGTDVLRDSLLPDYWKGSPQMVAVTIKQLKRYTNGEDTGWTVLREPTKTTLGIVYKDSIDSTDLKGAYTDIKLKSADVDVYGKNNRSYANVTKAGLDNFKLVLSQAEKETAGIEEDFVESLVKGTAHSMAVKDSQSIRDVMILAENRFIGTDEGKLSELEDILKSDNVDAPWFVKLDNDKTYSSLSKSVRAKYKEVGDRASDVKSSTGAKFSDEVHLVRKDTSHILLGSHADSLFKSKNLQWALRITKDIMAGTKIGMVVLNPIKIAVDMMSNLAYLSVSGVPITFMAKNFREIARDYNEYQNLVHKTVQLKVRIASGNSSQEDNNRLAELQKQIDSNSVGDLAHKGFINSLGSDLVARNSDVSSGLQADMQTALEYLLKNKKGNKNIVGHFIQKLHQTGFQSEDFVKYLGDIVGRSKDGKGVHQQLDLTVERIKEIKTEEDIVAYVSQYTTSPGSELVRLGSSTTDLVDVLAKETLYRHAVQNEGMSPEKARIHVLDSFPDYKENLPLAIKQLSDVGIIMFPSFWLRIQKSIYRLARDKPINLTTELLIEEYVTGNVSTIIDANIYNKYESFGGILHTPLESAGVNSLVGTNLLNGF